MKIFISTLIIFLFSFASQVLFWRIFKLRNKSNLIVYIFGAGLIVGISGLFLFQNVLGTLGFTKISILETIHLTIFYGALTFTYYMFYMGIIDTSPTLAIVRSLMKAGEEGFTLSDFDVFFCDQQLILPRLDYLVQSEMVTKKENLYTIAPNGAKFLKWFVRFPKIIFPDNHSGKIG